MVDFTPVTSLMIREPLMLLVWCSPTDLVSVFPHRCGICQQTTDQHLLAKCDSCHQHFHLGCLDPPLTRMPKKSKLFGWWVVLGMYACLQSHTQTHTHYILLLKIAIKVFTSLLWPALAFSATSVFRLTSSCPWAFSPYEIRFLYLARWGRHFLPKASTSAFALLIQEI